MKALLVIDVQKGIVEQGDFSKKTALIEGLMKDFKASGAPVIAIRHTDQDQQSPLHQDAAGSELLEPIKNYADSIIEKHTPSAFFNTLLAETLEKLGITHLVIVGFETEFCCMFTTIAAYDRGYKVTLIPDAIGSTTTAETYGMPGLEINRLISTIFSWSGAVEVLSYDKYVEESQSEQKV